MCDGNGFQVFSDQISALIPTTGTIETCEDFGEALLYHAIASRATLVVLTNRINIPDEQLGDIVDRIAEDFDEMIREELKVSMRGFAATQN